MKELEQALETPTEEAAALGIGGQAVIYSRGELEVG